MYTNLNLIGFRGNALWQTDGGNSDSSGPPYKRAHLYTFPEKEHPDRSLNGAHQASNLRLPSRVHRSHGPQTVAIPRAACQNLYRIGDRRTCELLRSALKYHPWIGEHFLFALLTVTNAPSPANHRKVLVTALLCVPTFPTLRKSAIRSTMAGSGSERIVA